MDLVDFSALQLELLVIRRCDRCGCADSVLSSTKGFIHQGL